MHSGSFRPARWLPGPHVQTVGARLLRSRSGITLRRERLELPDGDFLALDWVERAGQFQPDDAAPLVLVLHGLEGCAQSGYALELYRALGLRGLAAVGLNFRSCGGELNRLPRMYHSGETGDLRSVLALLSQRFADRPLAAVGFSLGGNVLLKYLGEEGNQREGKERVQAAAAISVPFDLSVGADRIERGFSRTYGTFLLRRLKRKVRAKAHLLDGRIDMKRTLNAGSLRQFDGAATAPLHGFRDAEDYYRRSSSAGFLPHVRVPTLLIQSLDDPFFPGCALPVRAARENPHIEVVFTERGGHVGFVSGPPWAPVFWAEWKVAQFLAGVL